MQHLWRKLITPKKINADIHNTLGFGEQFHHTEFLSDGAMDRQYQDTIKSETIIGAYYH